MLTYTQFKTLYAHLGNPSISQREVAALGDLSLGSVNASVRALVANGFLSRDGAVTEAGLKALEPHKVQNAIIMAAGLSSRFAPISYERPKGVLRVRGEVLIERQIRQLQEAGIHDITVVVGYRKEEFFYLEDLLGVSIVVNEDYAVRNNNSTIKRVEHLLGNTYICSSDDYFTENPFEQYVYKAYYSAVYMQGPTPEYCLETKGRYNRIVSVTVGGADSWVMMGHVYWDNAFSQAFCKILDRIYDKPQTAALLWEDIYKTHLRDLHMVMRCYEPGIIWEFDSLDELKEFDPHFIENVDSSILDNICAVLSCERNDICDIEPIKQGLTNLSCRFVVKGLRYVYRHPGNGTNDIIDRASEAKSQEVARDLGLDSTFIYEHPEQGWKISRFVDDCSELDYANAQQVKHAMELIRRLHQASVETAFEFDLVEQARFIEQKLLAHNAQPFRDFDELRQKVAQAYELAKGRAARRCLCHNDFYAPNFLVSENGMELIDWEYSGMSDYASDLGTFICCCDFYTYDDALDVLRAYFGGEPTEEELIHCMGYVALASYYWFVWALYKEACDDPVGDWLYLWYKNAKAYANKTIELAG